MKQPLIFVICGGSENQNNYIAAILEMEFDFDVFVIIDPPFRKQIEDFIKTSKSGRVAILGYYERYNLIWAGSSTPVRDAFYVVGEDDVSLDKFRHFIHSMI
jgi:hypothetical protein